MITGRTIVMERSMQVSWRMGAICVACLGLLMLAGCSDRRSEQQRGEGDVRFEKGRIEEAKQAYQQAAETNPDNPMAQLGLARCAVVENEIESALALYAKTRELNPNQEEAYMEPVRILAEGGQIDDALALAETYAGLAPEKGGLLYSAVLLKAKRIPEAAARLEALREQYPNSPEVLLNLSVAYS